MQLHHSSTAYKGAFAGRRSNKTNPAVIQAPAAPCRAVRRDATSDNADGQVQQQHNAGAAQPPTTDPEAKYKRYGSHFGGRFWLSDLVDSAPRVRVRTSASRQRSELLELAVLNERLAGEVEPWEARARLEVLRNRRHAWNAVYELINGADAAATLEMIEAAAEQVDALLSNEERERTSLGDLRQQLSTLQQQVQAASEKLAATQSRVDQNLRRVENLKREAAALERARTMVSAAATARAPELEAPVVRDGAPAAALVPQGEGARRRNRGLAASLDAEPALKNFWFPAEFTSKLTKDTMVPFELFDEPWVLFRDEAGRPACIRDECAHRACPLSAGGKVVNGQLECPYHGWRFNGSGDCTTMPSTVHCRGVHVAALPCVEKDGFLWVWPGEDEPGEVPSCTMPPPGYVIHAEICMEVPVEHGLLVENLLDLAHAPFTHTSTFARGWPVPEMVKFHAGQLLSGTWDPYPIHMGFLPPCMTISNIGLAQPGKIERGVTADQCTRHLHQLHVCTPAKRGHTRLLYRMSMDFMGWVKHVPLIDGLWRSVAGQVLGEDLKLVVGQQDRLERGGDTWMTPVSYDKIGVRYRRWRNTVAAGEVFGDARGAAQMATAGQVFAVDTAAEAVLEGVAEGFADQIELAARLLEEEAQQKARQAAGHQQQ